MMRVWVHSTDADVVVLSETWLSKSISDYNINIYGYNVHRADHPKRGRGVAIYVKKKNKFQVNLNLSLNNLRF